MKHPILLAAILSLTATGALLTAPAAHAQVIDTTTATFTCEGTISNIRPETFAVQTTIGRQEIEYSPATTLYVDKNDSPVAVSSVSNGLPVKVFYKKMGDRIVATKVMVGKVTTATNSTTVDPGSPISPAVTTKVGVVTTVGPDTFMIRAEGAADPYPYTLSKTTTYFDETGKPVTLEAVQSSGKPVTVYYTEEGGKMVASKVMIQTPASPITK